MKRKLKLGLVTACPDCLNELNPAAQKSHDLSHKETFFVVEGNQTYCGSLFMQLCAFSQN